ncbi:hypothetical protein NLG42_00410 [Flavobacterium plurextorum]|uniref:hypothetical protein n=1 Tax=Flavobacterium TaxID=237 RepID=UPI00214D32B6|nr:MULTISPECIES: hypothetical protein [Flavobacterium]UUW09287.1 hypothetical protein NLG42_00410 [Flavobacterium plurextorum]
MKKQDIEDIFSSMEDFSSVPPPELWGQIEEKLDKPKKKKKVILWWSAAACLLLGLLLPSVLNFTSNSGIKTINNDALENNKVVLEPKDNKNTNGKENGTENKTINNQISSSENEHNQSNQNQETVNTGANSQSKYDKNEAASKTNASKNALNNVAVQQNYVPAKANGFNSASKNQISDIEKRKADKVLAEKTFTSGKKNQFNTGLNNALASSIFEEKSTSKTQRKTVVSLSSNAVNSSAYQQKTDKAIQENRSIASAKNDNLKNNNSNITNSLTKKDSIQLRELQNLEKGIAATESKKEKEDKTLSKQDKWALQLFAGVGSSENYKNNKTLGNVNDSKQSNSYGVKTQYKINKKWAVASGVKINELGQSVANVSYLSAKNNAFFSASDYFAQNVSAPYIASDANYVLVSNSTKEAMKSENIQTGNLDQNLRYVEMPLEVSYSVFSKNKASINLNTGGFVGKLISNSVSIDGSSIGENVNANDYVYGSTLSSTIQYRVYKKTNVFVEPAVNYYVNPLNSQSFNQFQWGLNFGLNVSF